MFICKQYREVYYSKQKQRLLKTIITDEINDRALAYKEHVVKFT